MVRGLCPRDCIRWAVHGGGCAVGDAGAVGHTQRLRQRCPGGYVTMVHRGRCTLQDGAYRTLRHTSLRLRKTIPHGSAETYPHATTVGGGVLDAPRLWDCRGGLVADVGRGRLHPRLIRCARWRPPPSVCDFAGTARAPLAASRRTDVVLRPTQGASRTPPPTAGARHTLLRVW